MYVQKQIYISTYSELVSEKGSPDSQHMERLGEGLLGGGLAMAHLRCNATPRRPIHTCIHTYIHHHHHHHHHAIKWRLGQTKRSQ